MTSGSTGTNGGRGPGSNGGRDPDEGASLRNFRLLPRRRLPKLPAKGEPWGGLLQPATLITAGIAAVLVAVVWIGLATAKPSTPTTLDGVTAEVTTQVDDLTSTLPAPPVSIADTPTVQACPDGTAEQQYSLERVMVPSPGFVAASWAQDARSHFEELGWTVRTDAFGDAGGLNITLVGRNLVPLSVTIAPADIGDPADAATTITVRSESRCTDTAG